MVCEVDGLMVLAKHDASDAPLTLRVGEDGDATTLFVRKRHLLFPMDTPSLL